MNGRELLTEWFNNYHGDFRDVHNLDTNYYTIYFKYGNIDILLMDLNTVIKLKLKIRPPDWDTYIKTIEILEDKLNAENKSELSTAIAIFLEKYHIDKARRQAQLETKFIKNILSKST